MIPAFKKPADLAGSNIRSTYNVRREMVGKTTKQQQQNKLSFK